MAVQGDKELDERGGLRWAEGVTVGGHVAVTLQDLTDHLVFGHVGGDCVECGTTEAAFTTDGVAVATLLVLEDDCAFAFERGAVVELGHRGGIAGPGVHDGTPRRIGAEVREDTERDSYDADDEDGSRAA